MKKLICLVLVLMGGLSASAQFPMEKYPNYADASLPSPGCDTSLSADGLVLTDSFLSRYPDGIPTASAEELRQLYLFFRDDPDGKQEWRKMAEKAARMISSWDIRSDEVFAASRYTYALRSLKDLSLVYVFTGNEWISRFIRGHLAKMADLPVYFWIHSELRGYDPVRPKGALETAHLNKVLSYALAAVGGDMREEEYRKIESVWRELGHETARNWLEKPFKPNNWTAVISCGLLYSSAHFKDASARSLALEGLKFYVDSTFEDDGSYAEGYAYLDYPVGELAAAALIMRPEELVATFGASHLRDCQTWRIYGMLFDREPDGKPGVMRISYGDNPYGNRTLYEQDTPSFFNRVVYGDGVAAWLRQRYGSMRSSSEVLLKAKVHREEVQPLGPSEARLPAVRCFDNGDCFIRSGWEDEGVVLAMKTGDAGSRVGYHHSRPELHSIALGAYGEYFIVTPGSASYRSRIHNEYDVCTRSANTVTVDGMNQKNPLKAVFKEGRWDNRDVWVEGYPHAVVTRCDTLPGGGAVLRSDASDAYHIAMEEASRTVRYVPEGGFFIIEDRMLPSDGNRHRFDYRLHFFNRDGATRIEGGKNSLVVRREKADLYIALRAGSKVELLRSDGYMHHPIGRDYDENGPKQGAPGSAIELDWRTNAKSLSTTLVLCPRRAGQQPPKIKIRRDAVVVDGKTYPYR